MRSFPATFRSAKSARSAGDSLPADFFKRIIPQGYILLHTDLQEIF